MPDLSKLGETTAEATQGAPALQALLSDLVIRLTPAMSNVCKAINETAVSLAKHGPAMQRAFAGVAAALPHPPRQEAGDACPAVDVAHGQVTDYERECLTLKLLALPFAGHPDYDESWRP